MNRLFRYMVIVVVVAFTATSAAAEDRADCNSARGDGAIVACSRLIANNPRDAVAYNNRGLAYHRKGDYDRAITDYDQSIGFDPKYPRAYNNRGLAYDDKGDYERAIADLDQAIRLDPKYVLAYSNRGLAYTDKGDHERAIADLDQAIKLDPKYARAYNIRGLAYYRKGDYDRAMADHVQAVKLDPTLAIVLQNRLKDQISQGARSASEQVQANSAMVQQYRPGSSLSVERRVALVIGNSEYRSVTFLPNPRRDAKAVAEALTQAGFQKVELAMDLDRDAMVKALRAFRDQADKADWALIYFAGHGIEINRVNYLIPVDARLADDRDVKAETVSYEELLSAIGGAKALRLIILDACRVNPFRDTMRRTIASRGSAERGLARPPETEPGTLVVYSAKDGEVAVDDVNGEVNSPFARAFVAELKVPGREVRRLFDYVRDDVLEATNKRQQPFTYGSLPGRRDFFFLMPDQAKRLGVEVTMTDPSPGPPQRPTAANASAILAPLTPTPKTGVAPLPQKVILYEEDRTNPNGSQFVGSSVWRTEQIGRPGQKPEVAVRADIEFPELKISAHLSLRRNYDKLPASHTIEIGFTLPPDFPHGGISNVPGVLMKEGETTRGRPLNGVAVKVTANLFLIGLTNVEADMHRNMQLLKERAWIDIPIVYSDGRRAILAIKKGALGERVFAEAFSTWDEMGSKASAQ